MADVTLSSAVRNSLLSLQDTTRLIDTTQSRLSTGLRVANAVDDPVSFFQAKTLNDRGFDFTAKKDLIDQGVSTVEAALTGIEAIEGIVRQIKGVATSLKAATGTQFTDLISQFNNLRAQIGTLTLDTKFQDVNLIDGTGSDLTVSFSDQTASLLTISSVNLAESGLGFGDAASATGTSFNFAAQTNRLLATNTTGVVTNGSNNIVVTYQGSSQTISGTGGALTSLTFTLGTFNSVIIQAGSGKSQTITAGDILTLGTVTAATGGTQGTLIAVVATLGSAFDIDAQDTAFVTEGTSSTAEQVIANLDTALTTLRSNAQTLGSNVALLQTRLDFTTDYVNTLEGGAAKLTLADINAEGANLLALQTRQQLGISALAFAGQAEQGVLSLFR
jgi:flagellin